MKLTKGLIRQMVEEVLRETNTSTCTGTYATPKAFNITAKPFTEKVERPKRPSHTKMFDYL